MMFLATFFPMSDLDELIRDEVGDPTADPPFEFLTEFLKTTVDLVDLIGIYVVIQRIAGKGQVKVLVAGVGWAFAELVLTRVIFLWVGARGIEFDWKYIQKSLDANISLVHYLTVACLIWLWIKRDVNKKVLPIIVFLIGISSYKTLMLDSMVTAFALGPWMALFYKTIMTLCLGVITLQLYIGITAHEKF